MPRFLLPVVALSVAVPALAGDPVDEFVRAEIAKQRIPGLAVAVVRDGKVLTAQGYGLANVEHQVPAKRETVFQSGSVGKMFTAAAVLLLAEDGKLSLDDPVGKHLTAAPESWEGVTVRHLLTHTGGTPDYYDRLDMRKDYTEDDLLKLAFAKPPVRPPGARWAYSNTGYSILGVLVSKVAGKFYGDFLKERVFGPLGMTTARIINEADIIPNRAAGYRLVKREVKNQEWVSPVLNTTGDGSLYVTVDDFIKWDAALTAGNLLSKSSYEQMWSPVKLTDGKTHPYGFGWEVGTVNGRRRVHHGGAWQGFTSYLDRYPDDKLTIVVLTNLSAPAGRPKAIAEGVARLVEPKLAPKAEKK